MLSSNVQICEATAWLRASHASVSGIAKHASTHDVPLMQHYSFDPTELDLNTTKVESERNRERKKHRTRGNNHLLYQCFLIFWWRPDEQLRKAAVALCCIMDSEEMRKKIKHGGKGRWEWAMKTLWLFTTTHLAQFNFQFCPPCCFHSPFPVLFISTHPSGDRLV